ncbi:cytochrome C biogenesis protein CcdA [Desulfurispirillum indicum]|uniref:Cytochrome c biogenesis protein transmembrane region n=1 Tax=Desulfurispirillum indicum (strain ATCC BAA-1389 / DSM 22839 / S5) TaxID=653733 RepID=E6W0G6_DESIS|nr:cytochrome c biogenesis protein CcdA [Desulfurispirillum indicum]ADU66384.1 cytochrome c biogenesis protein transmembrane region [Desulfurispirillum indicum S5]UCZ55717.1 cytochrome C biogenesis protein CcdA [Desulfurispirillum indicum]
MDLTLWTAFIAGILSFISPCLLPLVPAYFSFITGGAAQMDMTGSDRLRLFIRALWFVLGFSLVFIIMGASASALGILLIQQQVLLAKVAGAVIFLFGLHYTGFLPIKWLYHEKRLHLQKIPTGALGSFIMGFAFGFGWTPCIGPILAAILTIAASKETIAEGMILLSVYSAGLGIPFLVSTLLISHFMGFLQRMKSGMRVVEIVSGILLMVIGIMIFSGYMGYIAAWMNQAFPFTVNL